MVSLTLRHDTPIIETPRVKQLYGLFDVPPAERSTVEMSVNLDLPESWHIGVIVGPSGSGKTTVARALWGAQLREQHWEWHADKSIIDSFPRTLSIKEIVALLSSVGFSSPPSWLRPYRVLSNGEQFRVALARTLAEQSELAIVDEFTSVVDRTVAQIGSAAVAKTVRRRGGRFVAVTCHYDVLPWLEPDWVYQPHIDEFTRDRLCRPPLTLKIERVHSGAWRLFRQHHYLDAGINDTAHCYVAFLEEDIPVAFGAVIHFPHPSSKMLKREHRIVVLPDYQGVGIGTRLSAYLGSAYTGLGFKYVSITGHPAMIASRAASPLWRVQYAPGVTNRKPGPNANKQIRAWQNTIVPRLRGTFQYVGPALDPSAARALLGVAA